MIITQIYNGLKRLIIGSTYRFTTRKSSTSLSGASWTPIFTERTKIPTKLISVEFLTEKESLPVEYRVVIDGEKIFPFGDFSKVESGICRNFMIPIEVAINEYLQIEVRSAINNKSVIILSELAIIEVI